MPISRTWYNTLVNDDGTGTTGTAIDKEDFNELLNAVDGLFETTGVWTPTLTFGGASTGITYGTRLGSHSRAENIITLDFRITLTSKGSSTGVAAIAGLPFTALRNPTNILDCVTGMVGLTGTPFVLVVGTTMPIVQTTSTGRTQLTDAHFSNTSDLNGSLVFRK